MAKKDSTFNRAFRDYYEERQKQRPASLAAVDWPLDVAHEAAAMLGVSPASPTPTPVVVVATPATPVPAPQREPSPLERGSYNQQKDVSRPPVLRR